MTSTELKRTLSRPALLHLVDLVVYFVILNLAAILVPQVISESVPMSVVTAILLKLTLEAVIRIKNRVKRRFRAATTKSGKVAAGFGLWVVLAGSKFVILELEALLLGDAVSLGGFFSVTALVIVLMVAQSTVRKLLEQPDSTDPDA